MEDNNVYVNIKINTDGVKYGTKEVSNAIARTAQDMARYGKTAQTACDSAANAFIKQNQAVANAAAEVQRLESELAKMQSQKVEGGAITEIRENIKSLEKELNSLSTKKFNLEMSGKTGTEQYGNIKETIRGITEEIKVQKADLEEALRNPANYNGVDTSAIENKLSAAKQKLAATTNSASLAYERFGNAVAKAQENTKAAAKSTINLNKTFKKGLTMVLKYGLGIRSIYIAWRKFRQAVIEGFKTLAKESPEMNKAISGVATQLKTLKNSFAAAFAPLVTTLAPIIESFLRKLNALMQTLSKFIALITGASTFKVATEQQVDYAKSLDKTGNSAKKAKKYLSGLDEIATFTEKDSSGGGDTAAFADKAIDENTLNKFKKLKDLIDKIKKSFLAGFKSGLGDWESRINNIKENFELIKDALRDIFTDPRVVKAIDEYVRKVSYAFGQIVGAIASIGLTIAQNLIGGIAKYLDEHRGYLKDKLVAIFTNGGDIAEIIGNFAESFAYIFEAFGGENGQRLTANIIGIFANAFLELLELASNIGVDIANLLFSPIINNKEEFKSAIDSTLGVLAEFAGLLKDVITDLGEKLNAFYTERIRPIMKYLSDMFAKVYKEILEGYNKYLAPVLSDIASGMRDTWENYVKPVLSKVLDIIGDVIDIVVLLFDKYLQPKLKEIQPLIAVIGTVVKAVWEIIKGVIEGMFKSIEAIVDFISGCVKVVKLTLEGDFAGAFKTSEQIIDNVIRNIKNGFIAMINGIIRGINALTAGLNKLKLDPPQWAKDKFGLGALGFNIPQISEIPALANGAVIPPNAPFLATLGDQRSGNNFEAPEGLLRQVVREESGSGSYQFTAQINRRVLFDEMISEAKLRQGASGRNPFEFA